MYDCKILADSISGQGHRLTTFEISYPYIIHAEIMTHRMFSRNTQSSRATPLIGRQGPNGWIKGNVDRVREDPFVPLTFRKNQKGMADGAAMVDDDLRLAEYAWSSAINDALDNAEALAKIDVHKALANRVLGPYQWFRMILTATDFSNFFALRCHPEAQAEIRTIAEMMKEQYDQGVPQLVNWHLPLVLAEEMAQPAPNGYWQKVSIGRCARVSYLTHDGLRDPEADVALYERLLTNGHMSPFEHVARPFTDIEWRFVQNAKDAMENLRILSRDDGYDPVQYLSGSTHPFCQYMSHQVEYAGNLHGWWSARMDVPHQHDYGFALRSNA